MSLLRRVCTVGSENNLFLWKGVDMKLTRLSLLLFVLIVTFLASPEAFGAKQGGGLLRPSKGGKAKGLAAAECFDIYCYGNWSGSCCGSVDYCLGYCDGTCGVPQGTCIYVQ
jgi:hypothetical protein